MTAAHVAITGVFQVECTRDKNCDAGTPPSRDRVKPLQTNDSKLDAPTRFYFAFIIALALLFIGFGLFAPRP